MNLEGVFHEICPQEPYAPNNVLVWADTFAKNSMQDVFATTLGENKKRLEALNATNIRVIVGNPPYSVGQDNQNDDNQNEHYQELDARIAQTYAAKTEVTNKNSLYDSYIRAYRWASDRIKERGVIGFVTNAGWIDSLSANGMRKCLAEEFSAVYVYHLKGNQRTSGERSRQEGGKVFGEGSRAPVAIVILVKNPDVAEKGKIYFHAVDDYLTRDEKLGQVSKAGSILNLPLTEIVPDAHGDWFDHRNDDFSSFLAIGTKKDKKEKDQKSIFTLYCSGLKTGRDAWAVGSGSDSVWRNMSKLVRNFNISVRNGQPLMDPKKIKWSRSLEYELARGCEISCNRDDLRASVYRPFIPQVTYFSRNLNEMVYRNMEIFPTKKDVNLVINISGVGSSEFDVLMSDRLTSLDFLEKTQCFPRWKYDKGMQCADSQPGLFGVCTGCSSNISEMAVSHFASAYGDASISADDVFYYVYGILHSIEYRERFANNLKKELPRIPRVATYDQFKLFASAGRMLSDIHVNFDSVDRYSGVVIKERRDPLFSYHFTKMKWATIKGKSGNDAKDKTTLIYNDFITIENIPLEAQEYVINKKSALDWIVEKACVREDKKGKSGIVNDFNDYATELGNSRYPLDLFLRVITVSLETMKIVKSLPKLEIHPLDL